MYGSWSGETAHRSDRWLGWSRSHASSSRTGRHINSEEIHRENRTDRSEPGFVGSAILKEAWIVAMRYGYRAESRKSYSRIRSFIPKQGDVYNADEVARLRWPVIDRRDQRLQSGLETNPNPYEDTQVPRDDRRHRCREAEPVSSASSGWAARGAWRSSRESESVDTPEFPKEWKQGSLATREALNQLRKEPSLGMVFPFSVSRPFPGRTDRAVPARARITCRRIRRGTAASRRRTMPWR